MWLGLAFERLLLNELFGGLENCRSGLLDYQPGLRFGGGLRSSFCSVCRSSAVL